MPKLQHTFVQGKMNKDLDERLVPNGQYRDAQNIQVSTSEGSDVGAVENILGNTKKNLRSTNPDVYWTSGFGLTNPVCVGSIRWNATNKIYWFIVGTYQATTISAIAEYDVNTELLSPVLVDTAGILNFDSNSYITGINVLDEFLMWTDNNTEPKKIHIERFKAGSTDFLTHTSVYGRNFIESDVTVIKKRPQSAPQFEIKSTRKTGTGVGCGIDRVTTTFNFTLPGVSGASYTVPYPTGTLLNLTFDQENDWAVNDYILLSGSKKNEKNLIDEYSVRAKVTQVPTASPWIYEIEIQSISSDMPNLDIDWDVVLEEDDPMFELKFPRLAYRWKYIDGEYSAYSPFTNVLFIPDSFEYRTSKAFNEGMTNNIRYLRVHSLETPPADVEYVEILYKETNSTGIYKVDKIDAATTEYEITSEILGGIIEPNQLLRAWDNVPKKALAQDIISNRVVYGNYVEGYDLNAPTVVASKAEVDHADVGNPLESIKSMRNYQVGIVYGDEYGRETPVFTSDSAGVIFSKLSSAKTNFIVANTSSQPPSWASYFKYYIKDTANEYYNVALDRFYEAEDGNIWLSFPSAERNKIQEDSYINLKKAHDTNTPVLEKARYKILDIKNEAPSDISTYKQGKGLWALTSISNLQQGNSTISFDGPLYADSPEFFKAFQAGAFIRVKSNADYSSYYEIKDAGVSDVNNIAGTATYSVTLTKELGEEITAANEVAGSALTSIYVYSPEVRQEKEYQGKFFAKINRDSEFEDYIINPIFALSPVYEHLANSNIFPGGEISDDPTDDADASVESFGWQENGAPYAAYPPTAGSSTLQIFYGPHTDAGSTDSGLQWYDDLLVPGNFIKFNSGTEYYEIDTVTTVREQRYNAPSGSTADDYGLKKTITLTQPLTAADATGGPEYDFKIYTPTNDWNVLLDQFDKTLSSSLPAIFETEPKETAELDIYYEASDAIAIASHGTAVTLDYFNCYSFGNGVESNRIRDDFNAPTIDKGTKASATLEEPYGEVHKKASLIYSGLYNSRSGFNQLNQFNMAETITKDLDPVHGSIQKLHARDTNLVAFCEDKVYRILADKDALYNADGNVNLTATNRVLGNASTFAGEFGISKNPESFASYGFRAYFADKSRNAVLRLSMDGITEISESGMSDFFHDGLKSATSVVGSYDEDDGVYNISLNGETVSFSENIRGWVTRKSFDPETGVSINGDYYTFKGGEIWKHDNETRCNFYGTQYPATVTPIINDAPTSIKNFKTLSYEGHDGWVADVITDQQDGEVKTWKKKEGIYFNYINGLQTTWDNTTQSGSLDSSEFSVQGLGVLNVNANDGQQTSEIYLPAAINTSLQIGDDVYYKDVSANEIIIIGNCSAIDRATNTIIVDKTSQVDSPVIGDFVFFAKDSEKNTSGIVGYYAQVLMTLNNTAKKELFAVNSEVFISSE